MNSTTAIHISQVPSQFSASHFRLSLKQQLEFQNRCERRTLAITERQLSPKQRAARRFKRTERFEYWKLIEKFLLGLTPTRQLVMNKLIELGETFDIIKVSAKTIARLVGCCRDTVQEVLKELRLHGFLVLNRRRWNNSSARRLHPDFFNPNLKIRLWKTFDAYRNYFQNADFHLKIFLTLQKEPTLKLSSLNISRFSKDDIQLYEGVLPKVDTQSRDAIASITERFTLNREAVTTTHEGTMDFKELKSHPLFKPIPKCPLGNNPQAIAEKKRSALQAAPPLLKERVAPILRLGVKGLVKLTRYPEEALAYGLTELNHHGVRDTVTNFELFESACIAYCHTRNIPIASDENEALLRQMGYVDSQPCCKKLTLDVPLSATIELHVLPQEATMTGSNDASTTRSARWPQEATIIQENPVASRKSARKIIAPAEQIDISNVVWGKELEALALKLNYSHLISQASTSKAQE